MNIQKIFHSKMIREAYLAWFAIALFYFYVYILRVSPGVLEKEIRAIYKATAEEFATLGSLYLLGYSLLQIPLGIIADRIGVKKMSLYSITTCVIGSLLFGLTQHFWVAQFSRFLIGVGSASAFMCALKYIADHFPPGSRGLLMGMTLALGTVGALTSAKSIALLENYLEWHDLMAVSAGIGAAIFILIVIFVKSAHLDTTVRLNHKSVAEILASLKEIILSKNIMIYAIVAIGLYTPLSAIADLWGPIFMEQKFGLANGEAGLINMFMYIGLTVGCLTMPWIAEKYDKINQTIVFCGFMVLLLFCFIVYSPPVNETTLELLLFALGFFCGAEMMCFTGALSFSKSLNSGEVIGVVNTLNMLGGAVVQQLIGTSLDMQWDGVYREGIRHYSTEQFIISLSILTIVIVVCCVISLLLLKVRLKNSE